MEVRGNSKTREGERKGLSGVGENTDRREMVEMGGG